MIVNYCAALDSSPKLPKIPELDSPVSKTDHPVHLAYEHRAVTLTVPLVPIRAVQRLT